MCRRRAPRAGNLQAIFVVSTGNASAFGATVDSSNEPDGDPGRGSLMFPSYCGVAGLGWLLMLLMWASLLVMVVWGVRWLFPDRIHPANCRYRRHAGHIVPGTSRTPDCRRALITVCG
jgi:hypothetical protein